MKKQYEYLNKTYNLHVKLIYADRRAYYIPISLDDAYRGRGKVFGEDQVVKNVIVYSGKFPTISLFPSSGKLLIGLPGENKKYDDQPIVIRIEPRIYAMNAQTTNLCTVYDSLLNFTTYYDFYGITDSVNSYYIYLALCYIFEKMGGNSKENNLSDLALGELFLHAYTNGEMAKYEYADLIKL